MAKKRKSKYAWLPKGFYIRRITKRGKTYEYVVRQIFQDGKFIKQQQICRADLPKSKIFAFIEDFEGTTSDTLRWLINTYLESDQLAERALKTQSEYHRYANNIINTKLANQKLFGDTKLKHITPKVIRRYLDSKRAKISANRHVQFLKAVFNWGRERYDSVNDNPCAGVKLHKEKPRDRYIEEWEYNLVINLANVEYVAIFMEIAYLSRARWSEIANLKRTNIKDNGIYIKRTKGSKDEITLWTPRLRKAIDRALAFNRNRISEYLIHDKDGLPIKKNTFDSAWQRLMVKALKNGLKEKFTFHDIKARGVSDHETKFSGHRSEKMAAVYDRKISEIKSTR